MTKKKIGFFSRKIPVVLLNVYGDIFSRIKRSRSGLDKRAKEVDPQSLTHIFLTVEYILKGLLFLGLFILLTAFLFKIGSKLFISSSATVPEHPSRSWTTQDLLFYIVILGGLFSIFYSVSRVRIFTALIKFVAFVLFGMGLWSLTSDFTTELSELENFDSVSFFNFIDSIAQPEFLDKITEIDFITGVIRRERHSLLLMGLASFLGFISEFAASIGSRSNERNILSEIISRTRG
ncbi:hypothetical protein U2F10_35965 [Leptothoe sp. EHU-05/26/07-4]